MAIAAPFEKELEAFESKRTEWSREHLGKFVVMQDDRALEEFFENYDEAFRAGLREFGVGRNFLVKQIWIKEPIYFVA